jgi:glucokinase
MYYDDKRIVLTLDAGGTNFVFSAIQGFREIVDPVHISAVTNNLDICLNNIVQGFQEVTNKLPVQPVAISFAFPGPADYVNGVIGDLPNFSAFRGGVPLGAFLKEKFHIPVYINNDGNLFAYGEALAGVLPMINKELELVNNPKRYHNLLGITLGTGFGAGVVIDNCLLIGDNGCGGDIWHMRNTKYPNFITEESVSIRAVKRVYEERSGEKDTSLTPLDIFNIAEGKRKGNINAAVQSFEELGEIAAHAIINALDIVDGLVVIGGGLSGASKYFLPSMLREMRKFLNTFSGERFPILEMGIFNLMDQQERSEFLKNTSIMVKVPKSQLEVIYENNKKTGISISTLGTSKAVSLGAYAFALHQLDGIN